MAEHFAGRPLFDVASYARRGLSRRDRLTPSEVAQIRRTVGRAPEVMVKVLTRSATTLNQVRDHAAYVSRDGTLEVETDDGRRLTGDDVGDRLVEDWDLDLPEAGFAERVARGGGRDARLVHKLIFSMPARTPPNAVLGAVRDFAREEFGLQHRYAFALHTDEPHPHVHVIVKAVSEHGQRLNIRKDTLRAWRAKFAEQLRARGVEANATERAARGKGGKTLKDGIYRAARRQESTFLIDRLQAVAAERGPADARGEPGAQVVAATNRAVREGYVALSKMLMDQGELELGRATQKFAEQLPHAPTERQVMRDLIRESRLRAREASRNRETELTMLR